MSVGTMSRLSERWDFLYNNNNKIKKNKRWDFDVSLGSGPRTGITPVVSGRIGKVPPVSATSARTARERLSRVPADFSDRPCSCSRTRVGLLGGWGILLDSLTYSYIYFCIALPLTFCKFACNFTFVLCSRRRNHETDYVGPF